MKLCVHVFRCDVTILRLAVNVVLRRSVVMEAWCSTSDLLSVCRYTSESSVSLNRSPGQPSSYRSDEELMAVLDSLRGAGVDGWVCSTHILYMLAGLSLIDSECQSPEVSVFLIHILSSTRASSDPLSKLPVPHKLAILATMDEVSLNLLNVSCYSSNTAMQYNT